MSRRSGTQRNEDYVLGTSWSRSNRSFHPIGAPYGRITAWLLLITGPLLAAASTADAQAARNGVVVVQVDGVITPVMADHIRDALDVAEVEGHEALLVELDTRRAR
jgi:hypothetical protein